jgi:hypothetical protein
MGFLSPVLLSLFAVLAVPLWLHLRRKRRQTPVEFPSLRYLKLAAARMRRQARVEDVGLLLLRLLLVALLALAFARPVVRSGGAWLGTGRSVESVVVIDATASMGWRGEAGTRFEAAKRLARDWITGLDASDAAALWILTDRLEKPVPLPIGDRGFLLQQLDALKPSEGSSGLAPAFHAAREWAESRGAGRKELVVITDNQKSAWDWPADAFFRNSWKNNGVSLVVLAPDELRALNVAVESLDWDFLSVREGALLTGIAKVVNHGDAPTSDLLECRVGGQVVLRKPVELPAGGTVDVPLSLQVPVVEGPVLTGEIALAGDALACDDRWHFALPVRHQIHTLVVERGTGIGGGMRPSFYLTRALAAGGAGKAEVIPSEAWKDHTTDGLDSVWFTGGAVENEAAWAKARAFAEAGGTVVITGDSQPVPLPADWPVTSGDEAALPPGRIATRLLVPSHPLLDGVWSEQIPFPPLPQRVARNCLPSAGANLLATLAGGYPLLVEVPLGKGRLLWLNASVDRTWGDLPLSPAYVALVQQMARAGELARQSATSGWVGEAWPDVSKFSVPSAWPADEDGGVSGRAMRSGLFEAVAKDGESVWRVAVNVRRDESDLRPVEAAKLSSMLPGKVMAGQEAMREWREEVRREVPVWPWILAAAAIVYLAEGRMSARAAGRREARPNGPLFQGPERRQRA